VAYGSGRDVPELSDDLIVLIQGLFRADPSQRLNLDEVFGDAWCRFTDYSLMQYYSQLTKNAV